MAEFIQLGKPDAHAFPAALGANAVGGHNLYSNSDEEQGKDVARKAIDNGIILINAVLTYRPKRSEELAGEVVKEYPHEKVQIATRGPYVIRDSGGVVQNNQPDYLKQQVEEGLERLQVGYIDSYHIHFPDEYTLKDEAAVALQELKREGKTKAIGVPSFTLGQLKEASKDGYVDVVQLEYNLLHRENEKVTKYTAENDTTFVPCFPLASGILVGKYEENQTFNGHRVTRCDLQPRVFNDNVRRVKELSSIAKAHNTSTANIVLVFYLTRPSLDVVIPGVKCVDQVIEDIGAANIGLTEGEIKKIDTLFPIE